MQKSWVGIICSTVFLTAVVMEVLHVYLFTSITSFPLRFVLQTMIGACLMLACIFGVGPVISRRIRK